MDKILWTGQHKGTCKLKDEAGFYSVTRPGRKNPTTFSGNKVISTRRKCAECKNLFIHRKVEMEFKKGLLVFIKDLDELN